LSVTLALACLGACAPAAMSAGLGAGGSFNELAGGGGESTATTPTKTTSTTSSTTTTSTNSHTLIFGALGAAVLLLSGIAYVIVRDARRIVPAGDADALERGSARDSAARLRKRRAKAKAARRQRKRNR
jgi:hypothetical protein